jgi:hypothetical protein
MYIPKEWAVQEQTGHWILAIPLPGRKSTTS